MRASDKGSSQAIRVAVVETDGDKYVGSSIFYVFTNCVKSQHGQPLALTSLHADHSWTPSITGIPRMGQPAQSTSLYLST